MRSAVPMRIAKIGHVVLSALLLVLGLLLLFNIVLPDGVWESIFGTLLILLGGAKVTGYLSKDIYRLAFQYDFVYGFILVGIGVIFLARPDLTVDIAGPLLGIFVFSDGVIKVQIAHNARKFGITLWWLIFAFAVLAVVGGLLTAAFPSGSAGILRQIMGAVLLIESTMSALTVLSSVKVVEYGDPRKNAEDKNKRP